MGDLIFWDLHTLVPGSYACASTILSSFNKVIFGSLQDIIFFLNRWHDRIVPALDNMVVRFG